MKPAKQGKYVFNRENLVEIRMALKMSQNQMADAIGVPINTLSRWERGVTAPDAKILALIYSLAKGRGVTPQFFRLSQTPGQTRPLRDRLIVIWDFQTTGASHNYREQNEKIQTEINRRFGDTAPVLKAFTHPSQREAAEHLEELGWRVWEGEQEVFKDIIEHAKSDSGQNPLGIVILLITNDDGFVDLLDDLTQKGVQVYLMAAQWDLNNHWRVQKLSEHIGPRFTIPWDTLIAESPKRTYRNPWSNMSSP